MMSYERGERKEYGHLQGVSRVLTHERLRWVWLILTTTLGLFFGAYTVSPGLDYPTFQRLQVLTDASPIEQHLLYSKIEFGESSGAEEIFAPSLIVLSSIVRDDRIVDGPTSKES